MRLMRSMRSIPMMLLSSGVTNLILHFLLYILLGVPYWLFFVAILVPVSILIGIFYPTTSKRISVENDIFQ